jgi:hypothetical protein
MIVIWGSGVYGKVDEVPRLFHVATRFGHLYYVPLIPLGSVVVLQNSPDGFYGVSIPFSGKSIILAWLRAVLVLGAIAGVVYGAIQLFDGNYNQGAGFLLGAAIALGGWVYSKKARNINRASYARAVQLGELLDMSEEARLMIEVAYGQMSAEEAANRLAAASPAGGHEELPRRAVEPGVG